MLHPPAEAPFLRLQAREHCPLLQDILEPGPGLAILPHSHQCSLPALTHMGPSLPPYTSNLPPHSALS